VTAIESVVVPDPVAFEAVMVYVAALCTVVGVPPILQAVASIERPSGRAGLAVQLVSGVPVTVGVIVEMAVPFGKE
jgi:hypothetical protein